MRNGGLREGFAFLRSDKLPSEAQKAGFASNSGVPFLDSGLTLTNYTYPESPP
jgi:hypothetical protein